MLVFSRLTQLIYLGALTARALERYLQISLSINLSSKKLKNLTQHTDQAPSLRYMTKLGK